MHRYRCIPPPVKRRAAAARRRWKGDGVGRIDRQRLDATDFAIMIDVPTRYDDVDMQGHVNNAAMVVILQEARAHFNFAAGLRDHLAGLRMMVASLGVEYTGENHYPDAVTIGTGVLAIGRTSFTLGQVARQNGRSTVYAQAVLVLADAGGPAPIPDAARALCARHMIPEL
jgi:acyl-CoA thioester hydrolase